MPGSIRVELDVPTAVSIAEFFDRERKPSAAMQMWNGLIAADPYLLVARKRFGDLYLSKIKNTYPVGTIERSKAILDLLGKAFPTEEVSKAYFENLEQVLATKRRLTEPGRTILAIGAGRCGSTSITAGFSQLNNCCATHENPPLIYWEPHQEQIQFHFRRFALLQSVFEIVFDASHWWLPVATRFLDRFGRGRIVAIVRERDSCAASFEKIKGSGQGSLNHWAQPETTVWRPNYWDPVYPSYEVPPNASTDMDVVRSSMIHRYITEYNAVVSELKNAYPDRVRIIRTEELSAPTPSAALSAFVDRSLNLSAVLNQGGVSDGVNHQFRF